MSKGTLFWILMILWFLGLLWLAWPVANPLTLGPSLLLFVLLALLGWQVFGAAVK